MRCTTASASCTGTPCSAKKRAVTDFPIPSEPVRPRMNMRPEQPKVRGNSRRQPSRLPHILQQRHQRQPENHKMIALDAFEQLDTDPLQLVATDARRDCRPHGIEVGFEETV